MLGIALGLASSVCWGVSDFLGGTAARRMPALTVLAVSQPIGLVLAFGLALAIAGPGLSGGDFLIAAAAGAAAVVALGCFYRAMALGSISVVATIGALGVMIPVVVGLARGEEPGAVQGVGAAMAVLGTVLVTRPGEGGSRPLEPGVLLLALLAAAGFGSFFVGVDAVAEQDAVWAIVAVRVGGVALLVAAALAVRPGLPSVSEWRPLVAIGVLDVAANTLIAVATTRGLLSLVAVAGSLFSAVTVGLARIVLGERLARSQDAGIVLVVAGAALIAAGA